MRSHYPIASSKEVFLQEFVGIVDIIIIITGAFLKSYSETFLRKLVVALKVSDTIFLFSSLSS